MKDTLKNNWIFYLGGFFVFMAFLYFLKMAIAEGWMPPVARVALSMILGLSGLYGGYHQYKKGRGLMGQVIAGFGVGVVYATFGYVSFSDAVTWSTNTIFIGLTFFTLVTMLVSLKYEMRTLSFIGILAGLLTPLVIKAAEGQVNLLFAYVLALNVISLVLSAKKDWPELRIMSLLTSITIYITYLVYFDPEHWQRPMFYLSVLFVVYLAGLVLSDVMIKHRSPVLNFYLGLINALNFIFWSIFLLDNFSVPQAWPILFAGLLFMAAAIILYVVSKKIEISAIGYFIFSLVMLAISAGEIGSVLENGLHHAVNAAVWLVLLIFLHMVSKWLKNSFFQSGVLAGWLLLLLYWFSVAWSVDWVSWFGVTYIPFLNPGALIWIGLATFGFILSRGAEGEGLPSSRGKSLMLSVASHVVVGGLLTVQIQNTWDAYHLNFLDKDIMLSVSWIIYALILFIWGGWSRQRLFKIFGTGVLAFTSIKVLFFDLSNADGFQYVLFLLFMGVVTLLIGFVNKRINDY